MALGQKLGEARRQWAVMTFYQRFEHGVILVLTGIIAIVIVLAVWNLILKVLIGLVVTGELVEADTVAFQVLFAMIFTVIIALEFKRSLLVVAERRDSIVQVRTVILIALLAIARKMMIIDLETTHASQIFALSAAIVALGGVYWLVRDQDRRERS